MNDELNDASSNPKADEHLPVSGEFDTEGTPSDDNPLVHDSDDDDDDDIVSDHDLDYDDEDDTSEDGVGQNNNQGIDENDINAISAARTDDIPEAPDPDGPANPTATGGGSSQ